MAVWRFEHAEEDEHLLKIVCSIIYSLQLYAIGKMLDYVRKNKIWLRSKWKFRKKVWQDCLYQDDEKIANTSPSI